MKRTAIVLELSENNALVMKSGGEFARVKRQASWQIGDSVLLIETPKVTYLKRVSLVATSFLFIIVAAFIGYNSFISPHAIISVDINPSIELGVNRMQKVVSTKAYNDDGEKLLESFSLKGMTYDEALDEIFESDEMREYVSNKDYLTFSVYSKSDDKSIIENIDQLQYKILSENANIKVECKKVGLGEVTEAHKYNISTGKYSAIEELKEYLPEIEVDQYAEEEFGEIKEAISECKRERKRLGQANRTDDSESSTDDNNENRSESSASSSGESYGGNGPQDGTGNKYGQDENHEQGQGNGHGNGNGGGGGHGNGQGNGNGKQKGKNR